MMKSNVPGTRVPGWYPGTRLLGGYPDVKRVPGYSAKIAANAREYPGIFFPEVSGYLFKAGTRRVTPLMHRILFLRI